MVTQMGWDELARNLGWVYSPVYYVWHHKDHVQVFHSAEAAADFSRQLHREKQERARQCRPRFMWGPGVAHWLGELEDRP